MEDATSKVKAKGQKLRLLKPLLVRRSGERRSQEAGGQVPGVTCCRWPGGAFS